MNLRLIIPIALAVLAGSVVGVYYHNMTIGSSAPKVHVTGENLTVLYPDNSTNGWLGASSRTRGTTAIVSAGGQYADSLTLYSASSDTQDIISINVSTPGFSIVSTAPNSPITFTAGATVTVTLMIQTPNTAYTGTIDLQFDVT